MVGKGVEAKSSRIFQQCYIKCCKLQNLTPLASVLPSGSGKVLDFCVDRIKYIEWSPILIALSCDLSLHSISIRCRQPVKTVLEQIDCERLAKTVNKRAVILTNFMLSNLLEATSQVLTNTTLLTSLLLEGLPLKIPYLNPLCEAVLANHSLQHLFLPRCLLGDAGCLAVCKAVRCLPNILTLDLSGCELTSNGAGYIADLVKYQKLHRYSENWVHTLRYRLPDLDTMAGLRRITLCSNPQLEDLGVFKLLDVLSDDLWIKALDVQNCGLSEQSAMNALQTMRSNTTLVILDLRHNQDISTESLSQIRSALRKNEASKKNLGSQSGTMVWLNGSSSDGRSVKSIPSKTVTKDRGVLNVVNMASKTISNNKANIVKKEKEYAEVLEEQLQEEISHRQQLEELNIQLVDQMKKMKQQQFEHWTNNQNSSGSEQSFHGSSRSYDMSTSSGSSSSVPIDQNTLSYIQQAFKDIYAFIKNNQCNGQCKHETKEKEGRIEVADIEEIDEIPEIEEHESEEHVNIVPKKAQSSHVKVLDKSKHSKTTKSAHLLGDSVHNRDKGDMANCKLDMFEKQMGDTNCEGQLMETSQVRQKKSMYDSPGGSILSDSSDTLVCSPDQTRRSPQQARRSPKHRHSPIQARRSPNQSRRSPNRQCPDSPERQRSRSLAINPREAFYSSSEDEDTP